MKIKYIFTFILCLILLCSLYIPAYAQDTTLSVLDYGAKGNGKTDDTQAIQKAIDQCPVHGTVYLPWTGESYIINKTLVINKPITITSNYYGYEISERTNIAPKEQVEKPLIKYTGTAFALEVKSIGVQLTNIVIHTNGGGIYTTGNSQSTTNYARYNRYTSVFVRCINNTSTAHVGFNFTKCFRTTLENCEVLNAYVGFYINDGTSITMTNCWARDYRLYGYRIENLVYSTLINCCADTIPKAKETNQVAYSISNCDTLGFMNCGAENVGAEALAMDGCHAITCSMHIIGSNVCSGKAPLHIYNSEAVFIGCRNNSSTKYALQIDGNSTVSLIGCSSFERALISGFATYCNGRMWVYPSV